jgi:hypothetical protein
MSEAWLESRKPAECRGVDIWLSRKYDDKRSLHSPFNAVVNQYVDN